MGDLVEPGYLQERRGSVASGHLGWQFWVNVHKRETPASKGLPQLGKGSSHSLAQGMGSSIFWTFL